MYIYICIYIYICVCIYIYIYIYICQIEKKKDHTEVIKPGSRETKRKQNEISQRPASGVSRRPAKKAGRVPTQNARPEKNGNNVKNRAGRQKQRDAYPPRKASSGSRTVFEAPSGSRTAGDRKRIDF